MKNQHKKVWLVTGASQGFGLALVKYLLSKNEFVVATTRDPDKIAATGLSDENLKIVKLDITSESDVKNVTELIIKTYGEIDVLVNNAGFGFVGAIEEASPEEIEQVFAINVLATLRMIRAVMPTMRTAKKGHIINLSSIAGLAASAGIGIYNLAKHAVEGLSEALYAEAKPLGIKVTLIEPGMFRTGFYGNSLMVSKNSIADYDETVGKIKKMFTSLGGNQPGNPDLAAKAIFDVVESETPPLRLLLGKDAYARAMKKMDDNKAEFERMQSVTFSTDYKD